MRWRPFLIAWTVTFPLLNAELLPIRSYTTADGLASDRIYSIAADSRGFLWFCTPEGLSRFDGSHFITYSVSDGLPHDAVFALRESHSGDRWIGTARGLGRIPAGGAAAHLTSYRPDPQNAANDIGTLLESRSGRMLAATSAGIFEWTDPLHFVRRAFTVPPRSAIADVVEDPAGKLWVGTTTGIFVLEENRVSQTFTVQQGLPGNWVEMLFCDSKGRMWAALRGGLALFRRGAAGRWSVADVFTVRSGLIGNDVKALAEARDGTLWIGTSTGISRLRWDSSGRAAIENLSRAQGLSDRSIKALAEDQAGNMWVGTESAGVMRIGHIGFITYREQDGLRSDRVWSVVEGRGGELLAVTVPDDGRPARSVDLFDGKGFHRLAPGAFVDHPTWGWNQVLLESRRGEWWAATAQGLCRFDAVKAVDLDRRSPRACYATDATVFRIFEDSKGGIWASAQSPRGDLLMRWDPATQTVFDFPSPRVPGGTANDLVSAFAEDALGRIWMGLNGGGLYRYNGRGFEHFQRSDGVPGGAIASLLASPSGLWIASSGGLGRIQDPAAEHPTVELYSAARGMSSNIVQCLVDDQAGRIYAATSKGVDRLDPRTGHVRHFSVADGLAHGNCHGAIRDPSGSLWFATTQGLSRLSPPAADPPAVTPSILITDLRIGGTPYSVSPLGETRVGPLELQPSQNQLQADFVGIDYEPGDLVRYAYQLEGADAKWSPPRSQTNVNYAALAPGKYRFFVKAVTSEGVESTAPAEIDFTVLPPLWRRWWFESLAAAVALMMVFAAHRYRVAQMMSLERMRTAIATDLHDDIGASLSQIAVLSEVARAGGDGQDRPDEPLERVATLARELVDSMSDIVWSIRSEPHGMDSLIRRMREFALDLLESQGIAFELQAPAPGTDVPLSLQARRQLFLVFKECIHNAARHSGCTAVTADLYSVDRTVTLRVHDNGSGLGTVTLVPAGPGGAGIPNMRRRAESLGGRLEIDSQPGTGCTVTLRLPCN